MNKNKEANEKDVEDLAEAKEIMTAFREALNLSLDNVFASSPGVMFEFCMGKRSLTCEMDKDAVVLKTDLIEKPLIHKPRGIVGPY